jgi:hypothetical protein
MGATSKRATPAPGQQGAALHELAEEMASTIEGARLTTAALVELLELAQDETATVSAAHVRALLITVPDQLDQCAAMARILSKPAVEAELLAA